MTRDRSGWIVGICTVMAAVGMFMAATAPAALLAVALVAVAGAAGVLVAVGIAFVCLYYAQILGVTNHDHQSYR